MYREFYKNNFRHHNGKIYVEKKIPIYRGTGVCAECGEDMDHAYHDYDHLKENTHPYIEKTEKCGRMQTSYSWVEISESKEYGPVEGDKYREMVFEKSTINHVLRTMFSPMLDPSTNSKITSGGLNSGFVQLVKTVNQSYNPACPILRPQVGVFSFQNGIYIGSVAIGVLLPLFFFVVRP